MKRRKQKMTPERYYRFEVQCYEFEDEFHPVMTFKYTDAKQIYEDFVCGDIHWADYLMIWDKKMNTWYMYTHDQVSYRNLLSIR